MGYCRRNLGVADQLGYLFGFRDLCAVALYHARKEAIQITDKRLAAPEH